jgi:hypothetical protein
VYLKVIFKNKQDTTQQVRKAQKKKMDLAQLFSLVWQLCVR